MATAKTAVLNKINADHPGLATIMNNELVAKFQESKSDAVVFNLAEALQARGIVPSPKNDPKLVEELSTAFVVLLRNAGYEVSREFSSINVALTF